MTADPHVNYSPDWETAPHWWRWVRETIGHAVFDPCPASWHPGHQSGLEIEWQDGTYANPPGKKSVTSIKPWWNKYIEEREAGRVTRYVHAFFNHDTVDTVVPSPWELDGWMVRLHLRVRWMKGGEVHNSPANRAAFWTTVRPAPLPEEYLARVKDDRSGAWLVPTGSNHIEMLRGDGAERRI